MSKQALINEIAETSGVPAATVRKVIDAQTETITAFVRDGDAVLLPGIGKFKPQFRAGRVGHNPSTGEAVDIPPRTAVVFSPAKALKDAANHQ